MKELVDDITSLTDEWYRLIGPTHHKDRCCHWYIETKWSYGDTPKYMVSHHGYILDEIKEECDSYDEALLKLKEILTTEIKEYIKDRDENDEETGW